MQHLGDVALPETNRHLADISRYFPSDCEHRGRRRFAQRGAIFRGGWALVLGLTLSLALVFELLTPLR